MDKKELWAALSAITVAVSGADATAAPQRAGVAGTVNPSTAGQLPGDRERVLFVGSDVFRNEVIRTDDAGLAHLLFLDQSSLTVGPNSQVTIDRFVYDPDSDTGELSLSAAKGVLRFVGGALSKTGKARIETPVGSLGIRGAVAIVESRGSEGETSICLLYGMEVEARHKLSGAARKTREHEHCLTLDTEGNIEEGPVDPGRLEQNLTALLGPTSDTPPKPRALDRPTNLRGWWESLSGDEQYSDADQDAQEGADMGNRDFDDLAS